MTAIIYALLAMTFFGTGVFFYQLGTSNFSAGLGASIFILSHMLALGTYMFFEKIKFDQPTLIYLIVGGVIAGLAQIFFFMALKEGKINTVVPIRNLALIVTVVLGIIFIGEQLTLLKALGIVLAVIAIFLLSI